jgi:hypothetical protein
MASLCDRCRARRVSSTGADLTDFARLINTLLQLGVSESLERSQLLQQFFASAM